MTNEDKREDVLLKLLEEHFSRKIGVTVSFEKILGSNFEFDASAGIIEIRFIVQAETN